MDDADHVDPIFEFSGFRLDTRRHLLLRVAGGDIEPLTSKAYELLLHLVRQRHRVVDKAELIQTVWPNAVVEENNLNQLITALRRAFGERRDEHRFIVTVPGRGYRFVAEVHVAAMAGAASAVQATLASGPPSNDVHAYQLFLQAVALLARPSEEHYRRAIVLLREAIALDPGFARAICAEASAHGGLAANFDGGSLDEALDKCAASARRALSLDPDIHQAHALLGSVAAHRLDWLSSAIHFRRSTGTGLPVHNRQFGVWAALGFLERAAQDAMAALQETPAEPYCALNGALLASFSGNDAEALRLADLAEALGWPSVQVPLPIIRSQAAKRAGELARAAALMKLAAPPLGQIIDVVYAALGDASQRDGAITAIRALFETRTASVLATNSMPMLLMHWAATLDDIDLAYRIGDAALDHFERGRAVPVASFIPQLWLPEMRGFRADARFQQFAGVRLRMLDFWREHGPPDGYELRGGRLVG